MNLSNTLDKYNDGTSQKLFRTLTLILLGCLVVLPLQASEIGEVYAIKGATIVTVTSDVINNGTIILRDGLIENIGVDITIPPDALIIEADSLFVYPGFFDAHTDLCIERPQPPSQEERRAAPTQQQQTTEEAVGLFAERQAARLLKPTQTILSAKYNTGVTTVLTIPSDGVFSGQSALINLGSENPAEMLVKSPVASHITFNSQRGYPGTLMAVLAYQKQCFYDAQYHKLVWDRYARVKRGVKRPQPNESLDALLPVLDGSMPVVLNANRENEIMRAIKLAREFNLNYLLSGVTEGWRVLNELKTENRPVLLSVDFPEPEQVTGYAFLLKVDELKKSEEEKADKPQKESSEEEKKKEEESAKIYGNAAALHKTGIQFAFSTFGLTKEEDYLKNVRKTVEYGLPPEIALQALTINPATIFGVDEQLGSLENGKIANVLVTDGDIFNEKTALKYLFIDGHKMEIKEKKQASARGSDEAPGVDVTGSWDMVVSTSMGNQTVTMIFEQSGSNLSGEFDSEMGTVPIESGTVSGQNIEFTLLLPVTDPPLELVFIGTVSGNKMSGTVDLSEMGTADWTATKPN